MIDTENIVNLALRKGVDEVVVSYIESDTKQVRFSNNKIDTELNYLKKNIYIFLAKNKKVLFTEINLEKDISSTLEKLLLILEKMPINQDFNGINPKKQTYGEHLYDGNLENIGDLSFYAKIAIESAMERGVKRVSGTIYHTTNDIILSTNYNTAIDKHIFMSYSVRAFNEYGYAGQAAFHTADHRDLSNKGPESIAEDAADFAMLVGQATEGKDGKFDVLFHPLCFGSLITYSISMANAWIASTGMSIFADKLNKKVGSEKFTLMDDPTYQGGAGFRLFDDEATSTKKTTVIENGILKSYLHNYSTAKKYGTETTGNAGLVIPRAFQPVMKNGDKSFADILSDMKKGLFIINTWYTRFQDSRNGDFSTIPRDGIFYIENGEIVEGWSGIRISDNMLRIFSNIEEVSAETEKVSWWDEVMPSVIPYVLVKDVNITKSR